MDTNMTFNCTSYQNGLHALRNYVAAAAFLSNVGWAQDGFAHMLKNKDTRDDAVVMVIGKVIDDCLFCGPTGSWLTGNQYGSLEGAKYTFVLGWPKEEVSASDFDITFKALGKIQSSVVSMPHRMHFLIGEGEKFNFLRFSTNIFKKRDVISPILCH